MFKPIEFFYKKKEKKSANGIRKKTLRTEWLKLNKNKLQKFVKKAELEYDNEIKAVSLAIYYLYLNLTIKKIKIN